MFSAMHILPFAKQILEAKESTDVEVMRQAIADLWRRYDRWDELVTEVLHSQLVECGSVADGEQDEADVLVYLLRLVRAQKAKQ